MATEMGSAVEINADLGPWQWEGGVGGWKGLGDGRREDGWSSSL